MAYIEDDTSAGIARRIRTERGARGWSLAELSARSGVSKAMLSAIERGDTSPTAALLVRIATAFDLTLSALIARAETQQGRLARAAEQPVWRDPATGYVRRRVSPQSDGPMELVKVEMPAGQSVRLPAASYVFIRQMIWLLSGRLDFDEGGHTHELHPGDCLELGPPMDCAFRTPGPDGAVYLVALVRR